MLRTDPRIDAYIARSQDFAKPILIHLREMVDAACPDVEENMKWSCRGDGALRHDQAPVRSAAEENADRLHQESGCAQRRRSERAAEAEVG
jgi:hypothetical protein